ncbi:hypothetical protein Tco_0106338 [Tanacetum coccineum]
MYCENDHDKFDDDLQTRSQRNHNHGAEQRIYPKSNKRWVTDMYWKMDGEDVLHTVYSSFNCRVENWEETRLWVESVDEKIHEVGRDSEKQRYFFDSTPTRFHVLNEAILRVIRMPKPRDWAWSIGIFALTFSECVRFI